MEAAGSITACAWSPIGFHRPRVPALVLSSGRARVTGLCYTDSNVTCSRVDFRPKIRDFYDRLKTNAVLQLSLLRSRRRLGRRLLPPVEAAGVPSPPLDLTEDNINRVLADARVELKTFVTSFSNQTGQRFEFLHRCLFQLAQLFDSSVGMTGEVELADLDGPFVKISLKGRFWHKRSTVLARVGNYLKQRIPEILEVDIQDEKQLDDSPENF